MFERCLLITGGSGLLALNWACAKRDAWRIVLLTHRHRVHLAGVEERPIDLDEPENLKRQFAQIAPDLVVHTAALTDIDACQADPELACRVNAGLARNVAEAAAANGLRLIHISTDHLFAGDQGNYREEDAAEPLNEYARSKLLGEEWVRSSYPQALVLRSNFFGWGHARRQSFSDWILQSLSAGREITLFEDVFFTPLLADVLVDAAHRLAEMQASGLFHIGGDERLSKFEFGVRLARFFGLSEALIRRGRIATSGLKVRRPRDMSLDSSRVRAMLGNGMGNLEEHFRILKQQELDGRRDELLHAVTE